MKFQAVIQYHSSLMDEYRTLTYKDYENEDDAKKFIEDYYKEHVYNIEDDDPENPISDLYDSFIQVLDNNGKLLKTL